MRTALLTLVVVAAMTAMLAAQVPVPTGAPAAPPDVSAPPNDAMQSSSGLRSRVITPGTGGQKPAATSFVTVHYTGWTTDGTVVDNSRNRTTPPMFPLNRSLPGWQECVQLMTVGEVRRCWLPQRLAYNGRDGRPVGMIVFDIELLDIRRAPRVPPPDVAGPPADAERTESGLAYKVLKPGTGVRRPTSFDRVTVHYTGWTTNGKMFDSSVLPGVPQTLALTDVIPGWTEGLQLMVEGERTRFWVPEELAYKGAVGSPQGMLVFEVDLIGIE
ncbi:MAG: FKBP-type peptidyl-prolyl cis-trans isomerase [Acidobacteria bacterium]|nr:FKBP-type peptidyl-prolyl cis-trans isomerase [Acidobacteriota bacterium]